MKTSGYIKVGHSYHSDVKVLNVSTGKYVAKWTITQQANQWNVLKFNREASDYKLSAEFSTLEESKNYITEVEACIPYFTEEDRAKASPEAIKALIEEGKRKAAAIEARYAPSETKKPFKPTPASKTPPASRENWTDLAKARRATAEVMGRSSVSSRLVMLESSINNDDEVIYIMFQVGNKEYSAKRANGKAAWNTEITAK